MMHGNSNQHYFFRYDGTDLGILKLQQLNEQQATEQLQIITMAEKIISQIVHGYITLLLRPICKCILHLIHYDDISDTVQMLK